MLKDTYYLPKMLDKTVNSGGEQMLLIFKAAN
jgi:hypothetical protein